MRSSRLGNGLPDTIWMTFHKIGCDPAPAGAACTNDQGNERTQEGIPRFSF